MSERYNVERAELVIAVFDFETCVEVRIIKDRAGGLPRGIDIEHVETLLRVRRDELRSERRAGP